MSTLELFEELGRLLKTVDLYELQKGALETIHHHILSCKTILMEKNTAKSIKKERKCLKCDTTHPESFNRKNTECIQCMSKAGYEKIKVRLEQGKERNILARISRKECSVCKLKVERENAQMFDWDHRNPSEKTFSVSRMNYKADIAFFAEIEKCELTCKNCHIMRTMDQYKQNTIPKRKPNTAL